MPNLFEEKLTAPMVATGDTAPKPAEQGPPAVTSSAGIFKWTKALLLSQTHLSEEQAGLVSFWIISSWFLGALRLFPCLVITGPTHEAMRVMHVLNKLCCLPVLVHGFRRNDLEALRRCGTYLVFEPSLNKRTADLLSLLTYPTSRVVAGSGFLSCSRASAIYAGEDPETPTILNSLRIHITASSAGLTSSPATLQTSMERLHGHLKVYRERNLGVVEDSAWMSSGFSPEMEAVASELGRCIVDAPELQERLVALLSTHDDQLVSDRSDTPEAVLLESVLVLIHQGKSKFLVREIAEEFTRIQRARGERLVYSPERIGHLLKKVGLFTRRLGKDGRGLVMDLATVRRAHELAAMYGSAGLERSEEHLHCSECHDNERVM